MEKKILTQKELKNSLGIVVSAIMMLICIGICVLVSMQNGLEVNTIIIIIPIIIICGGLIAIYATFNQQVKNGQLKIYICTVIDQRRRRPRTSSNRSTHYEVKFDKADAIMPNFNQWTSISQKTYNSLEFNDKCYVVIIGTENMYSTKVFPVKEYELSEDLQSKIQILY